MIRPLCSRWQVAVLALAVLLGPAFLGCGAGEPGDAERRYLRDVCTAGSGLVAAAVEVQAPVGAAEESPRELLRPLTEALEAVVGAFRGATPPSGVEEYHAALIAQYEEMLALIDETLTAVEAGEDAIGALFMRLGTLMGASQLPELTPETWERLVGAARDVPECTRENSILGFMGAGVDPPSGEVPPADEEYVRGICLAGTAYLDAYVEELANVSLDVSNPEEFLEATGRSMAVLATAMADMAPPDGLGEHHAATLTYFEYFVRVAGLGDAIDELSGEDLARLQAMAEDGFAQPSPSPDVRNRIEQAAIGVPECYGSGFLLTFVGEGRSAQPVP